MLSLLDTCLPGSLLVLRLRHLPGSQFGWTLACLETYLFHDRDTCLDACLPGYLPAWKRACSSTETAASISACIDTGLPRHLLVPPLRQLAGSLLAWTPIFLDACRPGSLPIPRPTPASLDAYLFHDPAGYLDACLPGCLPAWKRACSETETAECLPALTLACRDACLFLDRDTCLEVYLAGLLCSSTPAGLHAFLFHRQDTCLDAYPPGRLPA